MVPVYSMSKFAVRGLTSALYRDAHQYPHIRVCCLLPGPIDTPMFLNAANYSGRDIRAIPLPHRLIGWLRRSSDVRDDHDENSPLGWPVGRSTSVIGLLLASPSGSSDARRPPSSSAH
jgi:NAD(P)-dependent dehydrogenase (short-subunit alcohol dehydrogenase family)